MGASHVDWGYYRHLASRKPLLTAEGERQLLRSAQAGDPGATRELLDSHMRLVVQIATGYAREGLSPHDLVGEGVLGLMEAVRRFDLARDSRFASYAAWWVRACVRRFALANRRIVGVPSTRGARVARAKLRTAERALSQRLGRRPSRTELAAELKVSEQDLELVEVALSSRDLSLTGSDEGGSVELPDDSHNPERAFAEAEDDAERKRTVAHALRTLSDRELSIVLAQFFEEEGKSLSQLGSELGVSRQRAGQILRTARGKLRTELVAVA